MELCLRAGGLVDCLTRCSIRKSSGKKFEPVLKRITLLKSARVGAADAAAPRGFRKMLAASPRIQRRRGWLNFPAGMGRSKKLRFGGNQNFAQPYLT
jgi:hypothetical protein